jgi:AAA+ ATPase superfamily predicted ATPase
MPNPFFYGGRIADPQFFVGREAELRKIFSAIDKTHTGQAQPVSVVGPRRIGKASLLYHLTQVYPRYLQQAQAYRFWVELVRRWIDSHGTIISTL